MILAIVTLLRHLAGWAVSAFRSRENLLLENLALRQQLMALHSKRPRRRLTTLHKLFWVLLRRLWSEWERPLILVTPRTVIEWHRAGFRLYWTWVSRVRRVGGWRRVSEEVRVLIFRIAAENPTWGAPRIHGELLKLGFDLSEPTVSRWLRRAPRTPDPVKRWLTFLRNHREAVAGMDFLHRTNAHVWRSVLLLRDRPRPAEDSAFQRNAKSECSLGCAANCEKRGPTNSRAGSYYWTEIQSSERM